MVKSKNENGWVTISRSILENEIWTTAEPFDYRSAWIDLILAANYKDRTFITRRGETIIVPRGSLFTSIQHLADRWRWSPNKVRRYIRLLVGTGMLTSHGRTDGTLLTLVKYRDFQDQRRTVGTTDGTTDGTADGRTDGTRLNKDNKETKKTKRASAPLSTQETIEALKKWASKGGET